ncbi:hypothetical protein L493_3146 [Bordetella bronchiseptica 99-R-0433]|nr:hypothetical protein L493_3146 [Bordetella bronchiseptica 99-R-0433]
MQKHLTKPEANHQQQAGRTHSGAEHKRQNSQQTVADGATENQ